MENIDSLGVKKLLYFQQISHCRSFRDAARNLGISQPALTRHVQSLEEELGVVLIHRHASGNTLTEAGRILAKKTDELLAIISSAKSALDDLRGDPTGTVTLGLSTGFAGSILTSFLSTFTNRFPGVQLRLMEGSNRHVEDWLPSGQAEIGIICLPFGSTQLVEEVREELWLVSADGSRRSEPIPFAELAAMQLALPLPRYGTRQLLDKLASRQWGSLKADNGSGQSQHYKAVGDDNRVVRGPLVVVVRGRTRCGTGLRASNSARPGALHRPGNIARQTLSSAARAIALALGNAVRDRYDATLVKRPSELKIGSVAKARAV
jgi:LysR family nitrogen assimilation transcriptional regulator